MDAEGSHTQSPQIPPENPQLFGGVHIYVDPGMSYRPKVMRTLKSAGAVIASNPKDSDFILVQSNVETGQTFLRDWGADKTVLEATWVSKSLAAGRLLKESDQWGGCLAVENPSIAVEDPNPLPTPRTSPPWPSDPQVSSDRSSKQPSGTLGPSFQNNTLPQNIQQPHQPPIHQNQMTQFPLQPPPSFYPQLNQQFMFQNQMGQNLHPGGSFPHSQTASQPVDPLIYQMVLMDLIQRGGLSGHPMNPPPYSQPPGLMPQPYNHSPSPAIPDQSLSRRSSMDLKGKGKATLSPPLGSSGSFRAKRSSSPVENIFTSESGQPLSFYVAIDVHRRADILARIKRNGGQISTQITADFAILSFRSRDFETLRKSVLSAHGTAVKPAFVVDSDEQNMLLDPSDYIYETPPKLAHKTHASRSPPKKDVNRKQNTSISKSHKAGKKAVKEENGSPGFSRPHTRSPSPPPVHTRSLLSGDKYRYPEIEDDYVLRYAAVLFARDVNMTLTALSNKVHAKMPHHSAPAWLAHISKALRYDIDKVKKRAGIALRKEQHMAQQQSNADRPAKRARLSASSEAEALELDLNAVAHFFANDGGDQLAEEDDDPSARARVWQKLTEKTVCKTEASWEVFYNKHHQRINELYVELAEEDAESSVE
ncbi:hypothetical protein C8R46DRAFT_213710 [Mycena filopes]|nr:hypothetical protein C8R46DRAFT_213710 [Mycena filopes]